ncbi:hypothetical protein NQ314_005969 [Rhamnusium bicolor]|uniref:HTH psq-type domain-containing protein n=1 Tax=Rhamnusium bicolor TaxID=1586634 RepID=A0AAV8ZB65_9CUCU|nr:hypothetical protein NQ314_005969 [Rhamnusium bicolor]
MYSWYSNRYNGTCIPKKKIGGCNYKNFRPEKLDEALSKVADKGWSIKKASRTYEISYGTI